MNKNWMISTVGGSSKEDKKDRIKVFDGYSTPPIAIEKLLQHETFSRNIWEPATGLCAISSYLERNNYRVFTSDINRWKHNIEKQKDFLTFSWMPTKNCDIITNPPFSKANEFVEQSLRLLTPGNKVAFLLRIQFLEGIKRFNIIYSKYPPYKILVFTFRLPRMYRFYYKGPKSGNVICFAWFIWIKGFKGPTIIKWIKR